MGLFAVGVARRNPSSYLRDTYCRKFARRRQPSCDQECATVHALHRRGKKLSMPTTRLVLLALALTTLATACTKSPAEGPLGTSDATTGKPVTTPTSTSGGTTPRPTPSSPAPTASALPPTSPVPWPSLDFVNNPGGNDPSNQLVALTFDDGPDGAATLAGGVAGTASGGGQTAYMLDQLKALGLKATFFICSKRATDLATDPTAQADLKRIIAEGHDVADHTVDHAELDGTLTPAAATAEFSGVQATVNAVLGASAPTFTMYRAPYGVPFQDNANLVATYAPATGGFGVHVGWGIDSHDWQCAQGDGTQTYSCATGTCPYEPTQKCVMDNINFFIKNHASGVILMHSIYKLSGDSLPAVVAAFKAAGYKFVMVEDFIKAKYGATSAQIYAANKAANFTAQNLIDAATASEAKSKWQLGTNEN